MSLMFDKFLIDKITVAARIDRNNAGDPIYGDQHIIMGKVSNDTRKILNPQGNETNAEHRIVTDKIIAMSSRVWLPQDDKTDEDSSRQPITVRSNSTFNGKSTVFETWL